MTLNLGLRWDAYLPYQEQHKRFSYMSPNVPNPAAGNIRGALLYGGQPVDTHWKNFQPRLGLAYSIDSKTVFRAGFVMADTLGALGIGGNSGAGPGRTGFNPPSAIATAVTGQPAFFWDHGVQTPTTPFPLLTPGFGAGNSTINPTGAVNPDYIDPKLSGRSPYYINWSAGLQRQLPYSLVLGITYSASVGHFLPRYTALGMWTNSMPTQYLALGSLLNAQASPATIASAQAKFPQIAMPFSNFKGTIATMLTPFPQYAAPSGATVGITCYSCDLGNSSYHSLQVTLDRRVSEGLTAQFAYTFAREIDDLNNSASQIGAIGGGTRNPYDGLADRGLGALDHRHNLHLLAVYALPFGKGQQMGGGNPIVSSLVSGWSLSGIYSFVTGMPLGVTGNGCTTPGIYSNCMVSYNPAFTGHIYNSPIGSGNVATTDYLNKSAFMDPAPYSFGNVARSAPYGLTVPSLWEIDFTVRRSIAISERINLQIAADFFNLVNSVSFSAPATDIDSANFGLIASTQNQARHIQFSGRITF